MIHEFLRWPFDDAKRALDDIAQWLTDAFAVAPGTSSFPA
jgi:hypothetical protein